MRASRILGFAAALALLTSTLLTAAVSAQTSGTDDVDVSASSVDRLTLSLSNTNVSFGSGLDFDGNGAGPDTYACVNPGGTTYVNVTNVPVVTVRSNLPYDLQMSAAGNFEPGRIFYQSSPPDATPNCATLSADRHDLIPPFPILLQDDHGAGQESYSQYYSFDVLLTDASGTFNAVVTYTATQGI